MFSFIKNTFRTLVKTISTAFSGIFSRNTITPSDYEELEKILIQADAGVKTTKHLIETLKKQRPQSGAELKKLLHNELTKLLEQKPYSYDASIYMVVGVNGSGKTTSVSKLANYFVKQNKKVLLVAADTFRAAAQEQLNVWAQRLHINIITGKPQQDPSSVIYAGCEAFKNNQYDIMIIDTSGRLQTKTNLMQELAKMKRSVVKLLPDHKISTLLTVDAMLGQNSFDQARLFHESTNLDGIILTKMDGTGKGAIIIGIAQEFKIPIAFISSGESVEAFEAFKPTDYIHSLFDAAQDQ
jgi:fused signal recognition particle receptor